MGVTSQLRSAHSRSARLRSAHLRSAHLRSALWLSYDGPAMAQKRYQIYPARISHIGPVGPSFSIVAKQNAVSAVSV